MPIYEYRCSACGFQEEFLQRLSDAPQTKCPKCGKATLKKLVSAAGFQLKGTGWYATDFKNSGAKPVAKGKTEGAAGETSTSETSTKESSTKESSAKESSGKTKESPGKSAAGKESSGKESSGKESSGKESSKAGSASSTKTSSANN